MLTNSFRMVLGGAILAFGMASLPANAYTIGTTDVGALDLAKGSIAKTGPANPAWEESWAEGLLGFDITYTDKTEPVPFTVVDGETSIVAFNLYEMPNYFVVKDAKTFVLFENVASLDWGVLDLGAYFGTKKLDDLELSHVTEFDGGGVPVPEPGSVALLGLGLIGLRFARKRSKTA